jgi:hypothetical protein
VNPVVTAVTGNFSALASGVSVDLTLTGGGQFVSRELTASDFIIHASGNVTSPYTAATSGMASGLQVVRLSNNSVRLYGYEEVSPGDVGITVKSTALRFLPDGLSFVQREDIGIATIGTAATTTNLTITPSGVVSANFTITLSNDTFKVANANLVSGVNLLVSGVTATIDGVPLGTGANNSGLQLIPYVLNGSGTMVVQLSGIINGFDFTPDVPSELVITLKAAILTGPNSGDLVVLTGNEQRSLIAKPRLTLAESE